MAFASLFTLLDDIASVLDDVSLMTKMAAKKTVGVVGDDLALNANQVTGVSADRELPIVWRVAKGSLANKLILIPATLLLSWLAPALITPLLMLGGAYLCFEGVEKLLHPLLHRHETGHSSEAVPDELPDENAKIKGAIRTDFILSAEIIIISMGAVNANSGMLQQALMLSIIGIGMTIFVYGLVAMIVKLDDLGLFLIRRGGAQKSIGNTLLAVMPVFMRGLSVVGTLAMFWWAAASSPTARVRVRLPAHHALGGRHHGQSGQPDCRPAVRSNRLRRRLAADQTVRQKALNGKQAV